VLTQPDEPAAEGEAGLTRDQARILELEQCAWSTPGAKAAVIRDRLGMTPTAYYQALNELIDSEAACRAFPVLVNQLRERRAQRRRRRAGHW